MVETINKLIRVSRQLLQELGREPSPEEIAEEMKLPVERVREILKIQEKHPSAHIALGNADHQTQIRLRQTLLGLLISQLQTLCQLNFLLRA